MSTSTDELQVLGDGHSSTQLPRLCHACQSVLMRDDLKVGEAYLHHSSLDDFIEAKHTNCYICSLLFLSLDSIPEEIQEILMLAADVKTPDDVVKDETRCINDDTSDLRADLAQAIPGSDRKPRAKPQGVSCTCLQFHRSSGSHLEVLGFLNPSYEGFFPLNTTRYNYSLNELWKNLRLALSKANELIIVPDQAFKKEFPTTLPSNTGSMETWSTVNSWIRSCSQHHECMDQVNSKWYPTRLIERVSNETFKIIHSDSISHPGQGYITLSHRWGSSDFIKLTTDNLSELSMHSPVSILPKTFQDALFAAQQLNIRYIWIDSLCIIQSGDDGEDWQREATEMANIYTNSFCNISADYGNNQTDGLFFERTPRFEPACRLYMKCNLRECQDDDDLSPELLELGNGCLCHIMRRSGWVEDVSESPLNRRAWVLQERLLAPRVIHFLPSQVSWECGETLAWEKAGCGMGPDGLHFSDYKVLPELEEYASVRDQMERVDFDSVYFWQELVKRYSRCGLTKQSDKLVAISGVARRMALVTGDQYVVGLRASLMPDALRWFRHGVADEEPSRQRSNVYCAPSFSWAAVDGPVSYFSKAQDRHPGLVASFIKHRTKPPCSAVTKTGRPKLDTEVLMDHVFGPMTSPEVELQARGILRTCHRVPGQVLPEVYSRALKYRHPFAPSKDANDSALPLYLKMGLTIWVSYDRPGDHGDAEANNSTYYFTITDWLGPSPVPRYLEKGANGLLLKSVDPSMGRFKRIGHVWAFRGNDEDPKVGAPLRLRLGNERDLPAWSYNEVTGEHEFYIV